MSIWHAAVAALPFEWAHYAFMQNALLAICIMSPLLAFLGCMIVNKNMAFFSDAIGHAGLTGIAIGTLLGAADPVFSMLFFSAVLAVLITLMRKYGSASADTVISVVMSFTVALGVVVLSRNGGFAKYSRYLVGDLLSIAPHEILHLLAAAVLFLLMWLLIFNRVFLVSINHSLAQSRGIRIWVVEGLFATMTALAVTVSIQWIGILVISALLILPAAFARNLAHSVRNYLALSAGAGIFSGIAGLIISYYSATASGATIVLVLSLLFISSIVWRALRQ